MIRATTPTYILSLPQDCDVDLREAEKVFFALSQGSHIIKKQVEPTSAKTVEVYLSQSETLELKDGKNAEIQLNWIYSGGQRMATSVKSIMIDKQLLKEVLT